MSIGNQCNRILGFGEVMMRLTPREKSLLVDSNQFDESYGGAECNVLCSLSNFGHETKLFTKLPDNDLGKKTIKFLRGRDVDTSSIILDKGRMGIYFLEEGCGYRNSKVIYDREYSAFSLMKESEVNYDSILNGVKLIHITGITPALNGELQTITLNFLKKAKERDIIISYDSNYRSKLWSTNECGKFLKSVLNYVDIAFLSHLDITNLLNIDYKIKENYKEYLENLYKQLKSIYTNIKYMASTKREIYSASRNSLVGYIFNGITMEESKKYKFDILDRIGGGDAFSAGILHGILEDMELKDIVEFGVLSAVLKHSYKGDINNCSKDMVEGLMKDGIRRICR